MTPKVGVANVTWSTFEAMGQIPVFHRTYFLLIYSLSEMSQSQLKQSTWLRIALCRGCCRCQALRNACHNDDDSLYTRQRQLEWVSNTSLSLVIERSPNYERWYYLRSMCVANVLLKYSISSRDFPVLDALLTCSVPLTYVQSCRVFFRDINVTLKTETETRPRPFQKYVSRPRLQDRSRLHSWSFPFIFAVLLHYCYSQYSDR